MNISMEFCFSTVVKYTMILQTCKRKSHKIDTLTDFDMNI